MTVGLDDEDAQAFARSVASYCKRHADEVSGAPVGAGRAWRELAALGLFELAGPPLRARAVAGVMGQLGQLAAPGPYAATYMTCLLLGDREAAAIAAGEVLVSLGRPPLMPWAPVATVFVELAGGEAWLCRPIGPIRDAISLAGDRWGRLELHRERPLGDATPALALGDLALAAYLVGAAEKLLDITAAYARERMQFGRPLGDFQAVSQPLAGQAARLMAAGALTGLAANRADNEGIKSAVADASTARLSAAAAALDCAYTAHQIFGAMGFTTEGPVARISHRIRQEATIAEELLDARELVLAGLGI